MVVWSAIVKMHSGNELIEPLSLAMVAGSDISSYLLLSALHHKARYTTLMELLNLCHKTLTGQICYKLEV